MVFRYNDIKKPVRVFALVIFLMELETGVFTFHISFAFAEWAKAFESEDVEDMHELQH